MTADTSSTESVSTDTASTAWAPARANQQLVEQQRSAAARAEATRREQLRLTALGQRIRAAFREVPLPLLAVQTHFSLLEGTASPRAWAIALGACSAASLPATPDRRGANHPAEAAAVARAAAALVSAPRRPATQAVASAAPDAGEPPPATVAQRHDQDHISSGLWAALTDRDDLTGLPAAISAWGRGRLAAGAVVPIAGSDAVLLAASAPGYQALCLVLTSRLHGGTAEQAIRQAAGGGLRGVVALVRDAAVGQALAAAGAEVWWRADLRPETREVPFPIAAVPLLTHLAGDRAIAPVLRAIRERGTVSARTAPGAAFAEVALMPAAYRGYDEQLAQGAALRRRQWYLPEGPAARPAVLHLPPLPPDSGDIDPDGELRRLVEEQIPWRYGPTPAPAVRERIEHELAVITAKRFAAYLLTVRWIVQGRRTCGRGSAASSIVVYLLGITNVDPLRWNLLFDRFLSPEREDPPDVDVDFAWDERDAVLARILDGFGAARVGMVATHQHLSPDGALREAARAHGLGDAAISAVAARLQDLDRYGIDRDGDHAADLPPPWPSVLAATAQLVGMPRHRGVHCGGVVITQGPLGAVVPVHPAAKRVPVTTTAALGTGASGTAASTSRPMPAIAWEKDGAEDLGLVKIDILGNRSLAVVRDCLADLLAQGLDVAASWTPLEDPATRELLATGRTIGCFYVESPAMRQLQAKVGDGGFDRLVVHSSIIRPAGMGFIRAYINRHHRVRTGVPITAEERAEWYPHPALEGLLSDSYGVLSYQEDVMVVARDLAGFSPAEANRLRKALGRADTAERLEQMVDAFRRGCEERHVPENVIALVWQMISSFAGYSFAKAHSASYAVVSMECAWLKAHHPAVFLARVIANEGGFYHRSAYVEEARRLGITIHAPCVLAGAWPTRGRDRSLRLGFHCVTGLSRATAERIVHLRPFAGVRDLVRRTGCSADEAQALLEAGAFDRLLADRSASQRAWTVAAALHDRGPTRRVAGQQCIELDADDLGDPPPPPLPAVAMRPLAELRYRRLGALPAAHPLSLWQLARRPPLRVRDLPTRADGDRVSFVALAIARKDVNAVYEDEDGQRVEDMAFVSFEDETGVVETTWFPGAYRQYAVYLERGDPLWLHGEIQIEHGVRTVNVRYAKVMA